MEILLAPIIITSNIIFPMLISLLILLISCLISTSARVQLSRRFESIWIKICISIMGIWKCCVIGWFVWCHSARYHRWWPSAWLCEGTRLDATALQRGSVNKRCHGSETAEELKILGYQNQASLNHSVNQHTNILSRDITPTHAISPALSYTSYPTRSYIPYAFIPNATKWLSINNYSYDMSNWSNYIRHHVNIIWVMRDARSKALTGHSTRTRKLNKYHIESK